MPIATTLLLVFLAIRTPERNLADAFCPLIFHAKIPSGHLPHHHCGQEKIQRTGRKVSTMQKDHRICTTVQGARATATDGDEGDSNLAAVLHSQIRQDDPEWYREYVSGILGEDYCTNRWPIVPLPIVQEKPEKIEEAVTTTTTSDDNDDSESTAALEDAIATILEADEPNEIVKKDDEEEIPHETAEDPTTASTTPVDPESQEQTFLEELIEEKLADTAIQSHISNESEDEGQKDIVIEQDILEVKGVGEEQDIITGEDEEAVVAFDDEREKIEETVESLEAFVDTSGQKEPEKETAEFEKTIPKVGETDAVKGTGRMEADNTEVIVETRAVMYRNITGSAMTYVRLADLIELGYKLSELERIQAEFLSIVVLDKRKCPSMGVPVQWKVNNPKAEPQIVIFDSVEEASDMVRQINEKERQERESVSQRRNRQEKREERSATREQSRWEMDPTDEDNDRRRSRSGREQDRDRRAEAIDRKRRNEDNEDGGERRRRRRREQMDDATDNEDTSLRSRRDRRRQRRGEDDGDRSTRRIYSVPRARKAPALADPPDPNSPIWVNIDTFRDLLKKESDLRLRFLGQDWDRTIEQENDWRTDLYKKWLWSLNNGVGESIVPPSRYERARRNQRKRMTTDPPPPENRRRPRRNPEPLEGRRDKEVRREPSNRPPRERGVQEHQQRRVRRQGNPPDESSQEETSLSSQRRARRRAQRNMRPPND